MKPGSTGAMILLALIAVVHVLRVVMGIPVTVGTTVVPMWASVLGTLISGTLAVSLWRESHSHHAVSVSRSGLP
jgi:hypothetical protein